MKKLYLLFAFLFALIGYQDAGAWNFDGSDPSSVIIKGEAIVGESVTLPWNGSDAYVATNVSVNPGRTFEIECSGYTKGLNGGTVNLNQNYVFNGSGSATLSASAPTTVNLRVTGPNDPNLTVTANSQPSESTFTVYLKNEGYYTSPAVHLWNANCNTSNGAPHAMDRISGTNDYKWTWTSGWDGKPLTSAEFVDGKWGEKTIQYNTSPFTNNAYFNVDASGNLTYLGTYSNEPESPYKIERLELHHNNTVVGEFEEQADGSWSLPTTAITGGESTPYHLHVYGNDNSNQRYVIDGTNNAKYYFESGTEYSIVPTTITTYAFVFISGSSKDHTWGFDNGAVTGKVTVGSNGRPSTMTFTDATMPVGPVTVSKITMKHEKGNKDGSPLHDGVEFTKNAMGKWTVEIPAIWTSADNEYYLEVVTNKGTLRYSTSGGALVPEQATSISESTNAFYFPNDKFSAPISGVISIDSNGQPVDMTFYDGDLPSMTAVYLVGPGVRGNWSLEDATVLKFDNGVYSEDGVEFLCNTAFRIAVVDGDGNARSFMTAVPEGFENPIIYSNQTYDAHVEGTGLTGNADGMFLNPGFAGGSGSYDVRVTLDSQNRPTITVIGPENGSWPKVYLVRQGGRLHPLIKGADGNYYRDDFVIPLGASNQNYIRVDKQDNTSLRYSINDNTSQHVGNGEKVSMQESSTGTMSFPVTTDNSGKDKFNPSITVNATLTMNGDVPDTFTLENASSWMLRTSNAGNTTLTPTDNRNEYSGTVRITGDGTFNIYNAITGAKYSNPNMVFNGEVTLRNRELYTGRGDCSYNRLKGVAYTFTWNSETHRLTITFPGSENITKLPVHMPLKESDFAADGSKKHYFIVGNRMGAWRLQPEWELQPQSDGTYTIENRMMYTSMFMVGVVDNYEDYIHHRYTALTKTSGDVWANSPSTSLDLSSVSPTNSVDASRSDVWQAILYNTESTLNQFGGTNNSQMVNKAIRIHGPKRADNGSIETNMGNPNTQDDVSKAYPFLVGKISFNPDNNTLSMTGVKYQKADIKDYLTFSIVGSAFRNQAYDIDKTDARTPRARLYQDISKFEHGWQEGYIQYGDGTPYVDGNGEFLYQTAFDKDWMSKHPTKFMNSTGFEYDSNGLLFVYDEKRTASRTDKTFGAASDETYRNHANTLEGSREISGDMDCYVVENVWMRGAFKVWSGWGGNPIAYSGYNSGVDTGAEWNARNGGHGVSNHDRLAWGSPNKSRVYFATANNAGSDDFAVTTGLTDAEKASGIKSDVRDNKNGTEAWVEGNFQDNDGTRIYFKRIELWFDRDKGFANSVLRFYQQAGGPAIWISAMDKDRIGYNYNVPAESRDDDKSISKYVITRYKVNAGRASDAMLEEVTKDADDKTVIPIEGTFTQGEMKQKDFFADENIYKYLRDDACRYLPGKYRYSIAVWYYDDDNDPESDSARGTGRLAGNEDTTPGYVAYSNDIDLLDVSSPALKAEQVIEVIDEETSLKSFDVKLTAFAPDIVNDKVAPNAERLNGDMIDKYVITLPQTPAALGNWPLCTSVIVEGQDTPVEVASDNTISVDPISDDKGKFRMPDITLKNVLPYNSYTFVVNMTPKAEDAEKWKVLNIGSGNASCAVLASAASITDFGIVGLRPVTDETGNAYSYDFSSEDFSGDHTDKPVAGGMASVKSPLENDTRSYVKDFTKANQLQGEGVISALEVTDDVLRDWEVKYNLVLNRAGKEISYELVSNGPSGGNPARKLNQNATFTLQYMLVPVKTNNLSDLLPETATRAKAEMEGLTYNTFDNNDHGKWTLTTTYTRRVGGASEKAATSGEFSYLTSKSDVPISDTQVSDHIGWGKENAELSIGAIGLQVNCVPDNWNWYNAFVPVKFKTSEGADLHYGVGFYATNAAERRKGYGEKDPFGGEVLDTHNVSGYNDHWSINYPNAETIDLLDENFAEVAAEKGYLPIKLHHVMKTGNTKVDDTEKGNIEDAHIVLLKHVPVVMKAPRRNAIAPVLTAVIDDLDPATVRATKARIAPEPTKSVEFTHLSGRNAALLRTLSTPAYTTATVSGGTTDIEAVEGDLNGSLTLFPNPAVDVVNIRSNTALGKVEIVSVDGSLVKTADIDDTAGTIDVSDMTSGLYIVRTQAGTARLIVR